MATDLPTMRVLMLLDGELRLEGGGRLHLRLRLERGIHDDLQIEGQRLFADEIERAQLHRLDDRLRGAEAAGENDDGIRVALPHFDQQLLAAEGRKMRLRDQEIGRFPAEDLVAFVGVRRGDDAGGRRGELVLHPLEKVRLGVNNEDGLGFLHRRSFYRPPKRRWRLLNSEMAVRKSSLPKSGHICWVT